MDWVLIASVALALVPPLLVILFMRTEVYCPDCYETIRGRAWEGADGLVERWRQHSRTSCVVLAIQRAERRARLMDIIGEQP